MERGPDRRVAVAQLDSVTAAGKRASPGELDGERRIRAGF